MAQPVIATTSSTDVTFRMTSSASGEISCIILPNNYAVPNASIVMSKNNGIGVYQNTVGAEGGSEVTFTVFNLNPGVYYDAYCAYDDIVSNKIDVYTSKVLEQPSVVKISSQSLKISTMFDAPGNVVWHSNAC